MAMSKLAARRFTLALFTASALAAPQAMAQGAPSTPDATATQAEPSLEDQFRDPPQSARPRVWWHWMNGNVTKDGIAKDLAWMKRAGIGGFQTFDVNLQTPQIVDERLIYMTPPWQDAFRFAASEADRLGLEMAIAASPGFSVTGGPWVPPANGLKKLVWSETTVVGGRQFTGKLPQPPSVTGPFQSIDKQNSIAAMMNRGAQKPAVSYYADSAVVAFPLGPPVDLAPRQVLGSDGQPLDPAALRDDDYNSVVSLNASGAGDARTLTFDYGKAQTVSTASLFIPRAWMMFLGPLVEARLEAGDENDIWRTIADLPVGEVPTTASFDPVTASRFRLVVNYRKITPDLHGTPVPGSASADAFAPLLAGMARRPIAIGDFRLTAAPKIDRFESKAGFAVEPDYFTLSPDIGDHPGVPPANVIDLTSRMRPDGSLDWTPPKGTWRVVRMGSSLVGTENHPAPPEATGLEVDKYDGPAVREYLEHYIGTYRDTAGAGLVGSKGVQALLVDSIEVGAANWTPRLVEQFTRLRGYDPLPWLPALTGTIIGSRSESDRFLFDFRRTLADLMASEHYGTIASVAQDNGLTVYGEALENRRPSLGDDMAMRRHADIPMAAMWTHTREAGPNPSYIADIKGAASVSHIYGKPLVAAESLTSGNWPWAFGPADLKRVIDLEFVLGVNRPVIHTSVHHPVDEKVPGLSLLHFGQHFNRHETWAEMARPWMDYIARNSFMLQQGRNVADVGYFYGEEAPLTGLYGDKPVADAPRSVAWDFINADAVMETLTNDGSDLVTPGGARYRLLYLGGSSHATTLAALKRIAALVEGGATVVGNAPVANPGLAEDEQVYSGLVKRLWPGSGQVQVGKGRVIAGTDVESALRMIGIAPDFAYSGGQTDSDLPFVHRKLADTEGGGDSYFVVNRRNRTERIEARFRVTGRVPELWHADTGKIEPVSYRIANGETVVPLTLAPDGSLHVVFRQPARSDALAIKKVEPRLLGELGGSWSVAFEKGRGAPATTTLARLTPLNESAVPGVRYFSGVATYSKGFVAPKTWKPGQPLFVDLGNVREVAEVLVNGKHAGWSWHAPHRIDIGAVTGRGRNTLEVRVANLWVNRLIGDAQSDDEPGAQKITWTPQPTYRADAPLRPSGLIGPVTLMGE